MQPSPRGRVCTEYAGSHEKLMGGGFDHVRRGQAGVYSQNGEDILLAKTFEGRKHRYYVELGSHDGVA